MKKLFFAMQMIAAASMLPMAIGMFWAMEQRQDLSGEIPGNAAVIRQLDLRIDDVQAAVEFVDSKPMLRVVDLPDDGGKYHLSLLLHDDWPQWPAEKALYANWTTGENAEHDMAFHVYRESDSYYQNVMRAKIPVSTLPAVLITDSTGRVEYKVSGEAVLQELPQRLLPLFPKLRERREKRGPFYIFRWRRPNPTPTPAPPEPDKTPPDLTEDDDHDACDTEKEKQIADTDPPLSPPAQSGGLLFGVVAIIVGGAVGGGFSFVRNFRRAIYS